MKKTITFLTLCLIGTLSFAQAPAIQWQKCLGGTGDDNAQSIKSTPDGGYIMTGFSTTSNGDVTGAHGGDDVWVMKISNMGNLQWQKTLGGIGDEVAYSLDLTLDGGYIVAGTTGSYDGDVTGNHGAPDAWVVKLSSTGNMQWQKAMGGVNFDEAFSIQSTPEGGYIMTGYTQSSDGDVAGNHGGMDAWVVKLDSTGNLQWQKCFGGTNEDWGFSIQPTSDGNFIMVVSTYSTNGDVTGNHGNRDAWVVKLSSTGSLQWQKCLGGTNTEWGFSIQFTSEGGYVLAGNTGSYDGDVTGNHGALDAWVVKLSSTGNLQWQKCFGGSSNDSANSIQPTSDGGYIVAGYTQSTEGDVTGNHGGQDAWVMKLTSTGNLQWQKCLGGIGSEEINSIQPTPDGGYIMAGFTTFSDGDVSGNHGLWDAWVVKLGPELATSTFNNQVLTLYPNPTKGLLQLQTPNNTSFNKIIITDSTGKTVLEHTQNTTQVDVEQLASGLYIIKAFSGEEVFVNKFVKE